MAAVVFAYRTTPHPEVGDTPFYVNRGYDPRIPEFLTLDVPSSRTVDEPDWLEKLETVRNSLQQRITEEQEKIRRRIEEQETPEFVQGQLVLVRKTPSELQQAHTKLTDRYDHPARVTQVMPNGVAYKICFLRTGATATVNRRNLKPLSERDDDGDEVLAPVRLPLARMSS